MQADLATRLFALAVTYSDIAERHRIAAAETPTDWKSMWRDLKIRLDGNFAFTKDQEVSTLGHIASYPRSYPSIEKYSRNREGHYY